MSVRYYRRCVPRVHILYIFPCSHLTSGRLHNVVRRIHLTRTHARGSRHLAVVQ